MADEPSESRPPRVGHKKSRKGCAQCKRRHVKCNEEAPCSNCVRHGVACSLAGGPYVVREDSKKRRQSATSSSTSASKNASQESTSMTATPTAEVLESRGTSPQPGPFQALTGLIDRASPGEDRGWTLDLQLMHHYMTHTMSILTEPQSLDYIVQIWQIELPKIAFAYEYVMHALLGLTALHKAHMEPEKAQRLRGSAVKHLDQALVLHRSADSLITADKANAEFVFTWLVALFSYAVPPSLAPIDAMVELFMLVKGINVSLAETWFWVSQGPFAPILNRGFQEAISPLSAGVGLAEGMDFGLGHLTFMLTVDAMMPEERRTCVLVLSELKHVYDNVVQSRDTCSVAAILCFPKQDVTNFAQLVKRRVPQAVVILAYYCVLLDLLDLRWWIHGWPARVLRDIHSSLDEQWRQWIEWPVQTVLLRHESASLPSAGGDTSFMA